MFLLETHFYDDDCFPWSLLLKDSPISGVLQVAEGEKSKNLGGGLLSTAGVFNTVENILSSVEGYLEYRGGICSVLWGVFCPPHVSCSLLWGDTIMHVWR